MRNYWLRRLWKLQLKEIEAEPNGFIGKRLKVSKGPYKSIIQTDCLQDLKDCFNLDAVMEMTYMIACEIGAGLTNLPETHRQEITDEEKRRIYVILHQMRYGKPYRHLLD